MERFSNEGEEVYGGPAKPENEGSEKRCCDHLIVIVLWREVDGEKTAEGAARVEKKGGR